MHVCMHAVRDVCMCECVHAYVHAGMRICVCLRLCLLSQAYYRLQVPIQEHPVRDKIHAADKKEFFGMRPTWHG